jgi:hypothetical protein
VTECPFEAPYYKNETKTFTSTNHEKANIRTCISKCEGYVVDFNNECVTSCPATLYKNDTLKVCFMKCSYNLFDPVENKCIQESNCDGYFEKSIISSNFICKPSCSARNKYIDGKYCVSKCPATDTNRKYVGLNNKCKTECGNDDGLYELDIGDSMIKCLFSCPAVDYIYYKSGSKKCLKSCPNDTVYFVAETGEKNYECRTSCPADFPYYLKEDNNPIYKNSAKNYYICKDTSPCKEDECYLNGKCVSSFSSQGYKIQNKTCVSSCTTSAGFIYVKKAPNNTAIECKKNCSKDEYYSEYECYQYCPSTKDKIGKNKECLPNCNNDIGVGEYYYNH